MPTLTEEDRRAIEYQTRQRRIAAAQVAAEASLAGDPGAAQQVRDNWAPVVLAMRENRDAGYDDPDCEETL